MRMGCLRSACLALCLAGASSVEAGPVVTWINGHAYEAVFSTNPTWYEARDAAAAMTYNGAQGHLATFVTRDEQEFVIASLGGGGVLNSLWLGGYQDTADPAYSEPNGGWKWITGEAWLGVAPNDALLPRSDGGFNNTWFDFSAENHTMTWWNTGGINDAYASPAPGVGDSFGGSPRGFLVEYEGSVVPEPASLCLLASGLALIRSRRRR